MWTNTVLLNGFQNDNKAKYIKKRFESYSLDMSVLNIGLNIVISSSEVILT